MAYLTPPSVAVVALLALALPGALVAQSNDAPTTHRPSSEMATAAPGSAPASTSKPKEVVVVGREIKPPAARHSSPEVDDEVLVALQSGNYRVSGKQVIVSLSRGKTVTLGDGTYRTRSGRQFNIRNARLLPGE